MAPPVVDVAASVVDWVIDYPQSAHIFEEFSINYCCAGKSLESACSEAGANLAVVCSKLRLIVDPVAQAARSVPGSRPMCYWIERSPPGWISRYSAATAEPLRIAAEVYEFGKRFRGWLLLPEGERWDTSTLQSFSAALFNRYRVPAVAGGTKGPPVHVGLLELNWSPQSNIVQCCIEELQQLLLGPFAVFKAVRLPLEADDYPSREELQLAERHLLSKRAAIGSLVVRLGVAIRDADPALLPPTSKVSPTEMR